MSKKSKKKARNKNTPVWKKAIKDIRTYMSIVLLGLSIALIFQAWSINMFPIKILIPACIVLVLLILLLLWLQYSKKISSINRILGKVLILVICVVLGVGNVYLFQGNSTMGKVSVVAGDKEYEVISVIVKADNNAKELVDIKDGTFAIPEKIDIEYTNIAVEDINKELKTEITTKKYDNTNDQAGALLDNEVDAMILNEAYRSLLDEKYPAFETETKVIYSVKIEKEVKELGQKVNVTTDSFNVYISGIDTYGAIGTNSRSDVNMIATVNPKTKQIVLTSIPRDYYVKQTCQGNQADKLTHSGIFGIDCTVTSMQNFTGLTFNYYARVNFSSLEGIVNAIGGINIYNEMSFYSGVDGTYFSAGNLNINGNEALKFSRERHAYADGDRQRGRNQMIVLEAIIAKVTSPSIITGYSGIMNAVGNSFQTNMTSDEMSSLVKMQLDEGGNWEIIQQSVTGEGGTDWTPANGFNAYVMYPDSASVDAALAKINEVHSAK